MESRWIEVPKMVSWALKRKKVAEESKAHTAQNKLAKARPVSSRINLL